MHPCARRGGTNSDSLTGDLSLRRRHRPGEMLIQGFLFFCGAVSILTTLGIVVVLFEEALAFFRDPNVSLVEYFTTTAWQPKIGQFGIFPLLLATLLTSIIGMLVALPLGLGIAIYLSEYATPRARKTLKPVLEILAGVPTVVYGYFALNFVTPILRGVFGKDVVDIFNMASAGLVIGILILPLVASMSEDALSSVPRGLREAAYGLGATRFETAIKIVVPAALSGLRRSLYRGHLTRGGRDDGRGDRGRLGPAQLCRLGRTRSKGLALFNPFASGETMTGHIVRISGGDLSYDSIDYNSIFSIALAALPDHPGAQHHQPMDRAALSDAVLAYGVA